MDTNNSNGLNKNIIIIAIVALIGTVGVLLVTGNQPKNSGSTIPNINVAGIQSGAAEIDILSSDLALFDQDRILDNELDTVLNDVGELSKETTSVDINSSIEAGDVDALAKDLAEFSGDDAVNRELDSALGEAAL